ncbi:Cytoplasmic dynein intermediate chain [Phaffia rhodozyma]|uniref:Cytoplasmic dynein intermediate chain n=1 Tax=Phaffia rhodozyma TaxID=264483 RepID=A0A0F7SVT7_PHARH|nr:Cytoplasmic dynein intermediate chain [Phaffia rhodozyma]
MQPDSRRAEIEAKKAKLLELRRIREERRTALIIDQQRSQAGEQSTAASASTTSSRREIDSLVASLLGPSSSINSNNQSPATASAFDPSSPSSSAGPSSPSRRPFSSTGTSVAPSPVRRINSATGGDQLSSVISGRPGLGESDGQDIPNRGSFSTTKDAPSLVDVQKELYELPSKPKLTYTKSVQTSSFATSTSDEEGSSEGIISQGASGSGRETAEEMRSRIIKELEEEKRKLDQEIAEEKAEMARVEELERVRDLTEDQRNQIYLAPEFLEFVENSSKIVQRALSDGYDYIKDYTSGGAGDIDDEEGKNIKLICTFTDDRWTKGRSVTDIDWSPKFPELSVASYNKSVSQVNDPDGLVAVWNLHLLDRPEFVFHSQTDVLSTLFSPFHANLIFGGTYSGQILLWDTRAKHLPVLKTPLSAAGHTYPVYDMKMVGTQNAHNLITSSTDGMVCSWLADMLAQPHESLDLRHSAHKKTDEVSITSLDFPSNETTTFWVGTEEGNVYQALRYDRAGAKAGLKQQDIYRGHAGPVTGLHFHPLHGSVDFGDLFLTSSVDWTVKLWRTRQDGRPGGSGAGDGTSSANRPNSSKDITSTGLGGVQATNISPIHSFEENTDYVYDVRWHPVHPSVFGTVDGTGRFDLWDLNRDIEVPTLSTQTPSSRALNKVAWDKKEGRRVALGSSDGSVYVYEVGEAAMPSESEWADFQKTLNGMRTGGQDRGEPLNGR